MGWLGEWAERKKITIDNTNIDSDLTHFPVPIILGISVGQNSADVSCVFDELGSSSKKIAVTKDDGTTQLYVEIELWDEANETAVLFASKSDLTLSSASTTILYLYYDASQPDNDTYVGETTESPAQAVWDDDFVGVWHMAQDPNGDAADCILDSTSNGFHGTPQGSMTSDDLVDGKIGKAIDFDNIDDCINCGADAKLNFERTDKFSIEVVFQCPPSSAYEALVCKAENGGNYQGWHFLLADNGTLNFLLIHDNSPSNMLQLYGTAVLDDSALHDVAITYDGTSHTDGVAFYVAGAPDAGSSPTNTLTLNIQTALNVYLGSRNGGSTWPGILDSIRISSTIRSSAWLKATHYALSDNIITWATAATLLQDASLDLSVYHRRQEDLASFLRAHDGVELHDLIAKLEAAGWDMEDLAAFLSAYYQEMEDIGMDLTTWGTHYDDLKSFLAAYFLNTLEDMKAGLETWATRYDDAVVDLEACVTRYRDLASVLDVKGQNIESLTAYFEAAKAGYKDLAALLSAADGIVLRDFASFLAVTDGVTLRDFTLYLKAVRGVPAFRSITAQRVSSVVHEVS